MSEEKKLSQKKVKGRLKKQHIHADPMENARFPAKKLPLCGLKEDEQNGKTANIGSETEHQIPERDNGKEKDEVNIMNRAGGTSLPDDHGISNNQTSGNEGIKGDEKIINDDDRSSAYETHSMYHASAIPNDYDDVNPDFIEVPVGFSREKMKKAMLEAWLPPWDKERAFKECRENPEIFVPLFSEEWFKCYVKDKINAPQHVNFMLYYRDHKDRVTQDQMDEYWPPNGPEWMERYVQDPKFWSYKKGYTPMYKKQGDDKVHCKSFCGTVLSHRRALLDKKLREKRFGPQFPNVHYSVYWEELAEYEKEEQNRRDQYIGEWESCQENNHHLLMGYEFTDDFSLLQTMKKSRRKHMAEC